MWWGRSTLTKMGRLYAIRLCCPVPRSFSLEIVEWYVFELDSLCQRIHYIKSNSSTNLLSSRRTSNSIDLDPRQDSGLRLGTSKSVISTSQSVMSRRKTRYSTSSNIWGEKDGQHIINFVKEITPLHPMIVDGRWTRKTNLDYHQSFPSYREITHFERQGQGCCSKIVESKVAIVSRLHGSWPSVGRVWPNLSILAIAVEQHRILVIKDKLVGPHLQVALYFQNCVGQPRTLAMRRLNLVQYFLVP